jgi:hypothetical protein
MNVRARFSDVLARQKIFSIFFSHLTVTAFVTATVTACQPASTSRNVYKVLRDVQFAFSADNGVLLTFNDVEETLVAIRGSAHLTPVLTSAERIPAPAATENSSSRMGLGSALFKFRGTLNAIQSLWRNKST